MTGKPGRWSGSTSSPEPGTGSPLPSRSTPARTAPCSPPRPSSAWGASHNPRPRQLGGVGGEVETVTVYTQLQFTRADGGTALIGSDFSGFLDPVALDVRVLGLDVLKNFSVILDYAGRVVCFLHGRHRYSIQES